MKQQWNYEEYRNRVFGKASAEDIVRDTKLSLEEVEDFVWDCQQAAIQKLLEFRAAPGWTDKGTTERIELVRAWESHRERAAEEIRGVVLEQQRWRPDREK